MLYIIIDLMFCLHGRRVILTSGLTPAGEQKIALAYRGGEEQNREEGEWPKKSWEEGEKET